MLILSFGSYIKANIWTILIIAVLVLMVALIIRSLVKDKKSGKGTCGGDCSTCHTGCSNSTAPNSSKYVTTLIVIDGMSCGMCEAHINDVIRREFDVKSVKSSYKQKTAEVRSKEPLDEEKLRRVIGETGYTVKAVHSTANSK